MDRKVAPQTKRFIASTATTYLAILVAIFIAYITTTLDLIPTVVLAVIALIVAGVAEYFLTYGPLIKYHDKQLSTFFEDYLQLIEQDIEEVANGDVEVRANIMRPTSDGFLDDPTYSIAYWNDSSDYSGAEFELEFDIGQGCVGKTHEDQQQTFCISPSYMKSWDGSWETTNVQEEVAGHLNTIIGTPIYRPSDDKQTKPVAVLIIDSENEFGEFVNLDPDETLDNIEFKQTRVAERAVDHARNAGILL